MTRGRNYLYHYTKYRYQVLRTVHLFHQQIHCYLPLISAYQLRFGSPVVKGVERLTEKYMCVNMKTLEICDCTENY